MDQRTVETLLRRLVERVEDSERRYGEALDELHARLDRLSQTTEAARDTGAPENSDTFDRLHAQVSDLARRLEQDTSTPLDDFERLGKALSGALHGDLESDFEGDATYSAAEPFGYAPEPSPFAQAAMGGDRPGGHAPGAAPGTGYPDFGYSAPEPRSPLQDESSAGGTGDLDKRLVEMAQRLEESIGTAMPTGAIEALNTRLDEIGGQLSQALETAPTRAALEHVEQQISEMSQQVTRAEEQLGKVAGIEAHLIKLIARLDEKAATSAEADPAQLEEIASKAATDAARLVAADTKKTNERLEAMHRDLTAMSDKGRESGDRLVSTLEAVHESLKQLVQQVERGSPALEPKPRLPFLERTRQAEVKPAQAEAKSAMPQARPSQAPAGERPNGEPAKVTAPTPQTAQPSEAASAKATPQAPGKSAQAAEPPVRERTLRDRLGAAIPDFKETETETPPPFGRAKRLPSDDEAVDLDAATPSRTGAASAPHAGARAAAEIDAESDAPDDLVAAARRAAQAAALRAEGRGGRRPSSPLPGSAAAEQPGRRKRSLLIIAAAVLLVLSAVLLYSRLGSKPDATMPEMELISPAPSEGSENRTAPGTDGEAPAAEPEKSGSWEPMPNMGENPADSAASGGMGAIGFTEMAKSSGRVSSGRVPAMPASELTPEPQLASLKSTGPSAMPPGVTFSIEDPAFGPNATAPAPFAMPAQLPLPPEELGPLPLREAAAKGDDAAQYVIAVRYADGVGTKANPKDAAKWLERAAAAGLAPAQYRLAAMYERGLGVDKDLGKARSWYAAAAKTGNVKAMHNLAVSVSGRDGGDPDYTMAVKWYGEAAAHGLADSQFNLGILAEHGLGMTKNLSEAYKWFSLAAAGGDAEAAKRREVIRVQLAPATLAAAEATVKAWKAKDAPADANDVAAQPAWAAKAPATSHASLVTRAQTLLNALGYDVGRPDGLIGSRTRTAVKLFQRRNDLDETGEISIPLVTQLERLSS